jgi:tetratricopeptide (TPR) repeat protein
VLPNFAHRYGAFTFVWVQAFAVPARTREDALLALARMPEFLPITDPLNRLADRDEAIGRVYYLAGQYDAALPFLQRAASSCTAPAEPFPHVWSEYELGMTYSALGRKEEACESLTRVVKRWGREPRSVTASAARSKMAELGCEAVPQVAR